MKDVQHCISVEGELMQTSTYRTNIASFIVNL